MNRASSEYVAKRYIAVAEAGRGFAAFYVLITHLVKYSDVYSLVERGSLLYYVISILGAYGHQAVLFFFLLSGFSIHYSSIDRELNTLAGVKRYYFLRFRRIYPIYLVAISLTLILMAAGTTFYHEIFLRLNTGTTMEAVLLNLLFMGDREYISGIIVSVLPMNGPLWSLSYEVLYYLVYPIFWVFNSRFGHRRVLVLSAFISVGAILVGRYIHANHLTNVFSLYVVWVLGASIAQLHRSRVLRFSIPSVYLLLITFVVLESAWVLESATYTLGTFYEVLWGLVFFCIMAYFVVSEKKSNNIGGVVFACVAIILGTLFIDFVSSRVVLSKELGLFYVKIHLTAVIFFCFVIAGERFSVVSVTRNILMPFEEIGRYSYALYIIHYPILLFSYGVFIAYEVPHIYVILFTPLILIVARYVEGGYQVFAQNLLDRFWTRFSGTT